HFGPELSRIRVLKGSSRRVRNPKRSSGSRKFPKRPSSSILLEMGSLEFREEDFVHLHLHSDYSLLQSAIQLKPLAKRLGELEMKACAVTDYGNMFGAVSFYNTMRSAGIRPIIG